MSDIRDHFVYTAYDIHGRVLYVGCTKDLDGRKAAHRSGSDWMHLAASFHLCGPYTYAAGRQVERERLAIDRPLYGFHPKRRTLSAINNRIAKREMGRLIDDGMDYFDAIRPAYSLARGLSGYPGNREPVDVTDELLAKAFRREREHQESVEQVAS